MYDVAIIGGGCAGLSAAMYAGRFQLKTIVFADVPGGTITLTDWVDNYPGFRHISGMELAEKLKEHALEYGVEIMEERVVDVNAEKKCIRIRTQNGEYVSKTLIFATGTDVRKLGIKGEAEFKGRGVHYCALCDGAFYKGKAIAVVGGSDSAAKEALVLSQYGKKVYIIYRGANIRAEPVNLKRIGEDPKIEVITNANVVEILGDKFVKKVALDRPFMGSKELLVDGLFIEVGRLPLSELAKNIGVRTNEKGEIMIDRESRTNLTGIFAAGDVVDTEFKQAITGAAEGVHAAYSAYEFIKSGELICVESDEVKK